MIRFSSTGTTAAQEFFQINSIDGGVSVKKALSTVSNRNINQYTVRIDSYKNFPDFYLFIMGRHEPALVPAHSMK